LSHGHCNGFCGLGQESGLLDTLQFTHPQPASDRQRASAAKLRHAAQ
jgi:hypothetical protein